MSVSRAIGCLLGQLAGDNLGALVEFTPEKIIKEEYPDGVRVMADGGTWEILAGQPTDDSELALALARSLVKNWAYDKVDVRQAYVRWKDSKPFDCGRTTSVGIAGRHDHLSQANGALMRASPLGIFCSQKPWAEKILARWDAEQTHPNPVCVEVNILFVRAIATAIRDELGPKELYRQIRQWPMPFPTIQDATVKAESEPPEDYQTNMGWVLTAWQNALYQLYNAPNLEEGIVDTIGRGGDTDTNAAICGALLGAVYGQADVPQPWVDAITSCRSGPGTLKPRPEEYWPCDALKLAEWLYQRPPIALELEQRRQPDYDPCKPL